MLLGDCEKKQWLKFRKNDICWYYLKTLLKNMDSTRGNERALSVTTMEAKKWSNMAESFNKVKNGELEQYLLILQLGTF